MSFGRTKCDRSVNAFQCCSRQRRRDSANVASTIVGENIQDHEIMVSFDVESLFINVPIESAVQAALRKLASDADLADRSTLTPVFVLRSSSTTDRFTNNETAQSWGVLYALLLLISTWRYLKNKQIGCKIWKHYAGDTFTMLSIESTSSCNT